MAGGRSKWRIPFKSLRYRSGPDQVWGINIRRVIRRKNEWTHLTLVPAAAGVPGGMFRLSRAATLVGLDFPAASKNIELKPLCDRTCDVRSHGTPAINDDSGWDPGIDVKYGVTANLTADLTVNTDFAQVEVDEQQVNLTRFSLLYPGEARLLPGGTWPLRFRTPGASDDEHVGDAAVVLQPAHRSQRQPHHPYRCRWSPDRKGRSLRPWSHEPGHQRRRGVRNAAHRLRCRTTQARHPTPQHYRPADNGPFALDHRAGRVKNLAYGADAGFSFFQNVNVGASGRGPTPTLARPTTTAIRDALNTLATAGARRHST
ncbi:MAG: DUF5916 domain-containing protein [Vicinamibacterales bacterium]